MAHEHDHGPHPGHAHHRETANLRLAFTLNLCFTLLELGGGYWTNSLAILADAVHDLGDSLSLGLAWWLGYLSGRPADASFSYGYRRLSLLGALITGLVLVGGSLAILYHAAERLLAGGPTDLYAPGMIGFAALGIVVNGLAAWRLHGGRSLNARLVSWHLLEDVLGWAAVGLVAAVILIWPHAAILDPILSILITLYILWNVAAHLRRTFAIFLQAAPEHADLAALERAILDLPDVRSVHHTHAWSLDGTYHVLTTHIVVEDRTDPQRMIRLKQRIKTLAAEQGFDHMTVELEYYSEACDLRP